MRIKLNFTKKTFAVALAGALGLSFFGSTEAADIGDRISEQVEMAKRPIGEAGADFEEPRHLPLNKRIQVILNSYEKDLEVDTELKVKRTRSASDPSIIGTPLASQEQCVKYLLSVNPNPDISVSPEELVSYYYEEGLREGIRPDVAFAQALKETGFFRYGGTVTPDQNNYCGLGTTSATVKGAYFATPQMGVRAHIQHLVAYATKRQPQANLVDPRFSVVREKYGSRTLSRWVDLNGRWAVPGNTYGQSIMSMFRSILRE